MNAKKVASEELEWERQAKQADRGADEALRKFYLAQVGRLEAAMPAVRPLSRSPLHPLDVRNICFSYHSGESVPVNLFPFSASERTRVQEESSCR